VTPVSIQRVTPDFRMSGPLRKPEVVAPLSAVPWTSLTACPSEQASIALWMFAVSVPDPRGSWSAASASNPLARGTNRALRVLQTEAGSAGSFTVPHWVRTLVGVLSVGASSGELLSIVLASVSEPASTGALASICAASWGASARVASARPAPSGRASGPLAAHEAVRHAVKRRQCPSFMVMER
jgi:hypothetical protein